MTDIKNIRQAASRTPQLKPVSDPGQTPSDDPGEGRKGPSRKQAPDQDRIEKSPADVSGYAVPHRARFRVRHAGLLGAFIALVLLPTAAAAWYLWSRAVDQYGSELGFTVRTEEMSSAADLFGGLANLSRSGATDADILYEFIQSHEMVRLIDEQLDLRQIYSEPSETDPVFAFNPSGTIEDLVDYWQRMVQTSYDPGTGLIEVRALAFTPEHANAISQKIFDESSRLINELSAIARSDVIRHARDDLEAAVDRLKSARQALTAFRSQNRIVDPAADIQGRMGLLTNLQQQLAEALIEHDMLATTTQANDPRMEQIDRRIAVIQSRIEEERAKFGPGDQTALGDDYATILAEFERLTVDREFAEQTYVAALTTFDSARAEAQRQSRYLAAYVGPTFPERSQYPRRWMMLGLLVLFLTLAWAVLSLVFYSLRDRS